MTSGMPLLRCRHIGDKCRTGLVYPRMYLITCGNLRHAAPERYTGFSFR